MAKLTLSDLRSAAHTLKHNPRRSSIDDAEFHAGLLQLLANIRPLFEPAKNMANLMAQASSYESSGHFELSLAAIYGLLENAGGKEEE